MARLGNIQPQPGIGQAPDSGPARTAHLVLQQGRVLVANLIDLKFLGY